LRQPRQPDKPEVLAIEELLPRSVDDDDFSWEVPSQALPSLCPPRRLRKLPLGPTHLKARRGVPGGPFSRFSLCCARSSESVRPTCFALAQNSGAPWSGSPPNLPAGLSLTWTACRRMWPAQPEKDVDQKSRSPSGSRFRVSEGHEKCTNVQYARLRSIRPLRVLAGRQVKTSI